MKVAIVIHVCVKVGRPVFKKMERHSFQKTCDIFVREIVSKHFIQLRVRKKDRPISPEN